MGKGKITRQFSELGNSMWVLGKNNAYHDTVVNSMLFFQNPLDLEKLRVCVKRTFTTNWRFKARLEDNGTGSGHWVMSDEEPCLEYHVKNVKIPTDNEDGFADMKDMCNFVAGLYGQYMPEDKPAWSVLNITNLKNAGPEGNSNGCVLTRMHHNIGDGVSLMTQLMCFFDDHKAGSGTGIQASKSKVRKTAIWPTVPPVFQAFHQAKVFLQGVYEGVLVAVLPPDAASIVKIPDCRNLAEKSVSISSTVDLDTIKEIKNKVGATVNDVLMCAITGALRKYIEAHKGKVPESWVRAGCLINMRSQEEMIDMLAGKGELGNRFNFLPIRLPVNLDEPIDRLYKCKRNCDDMKVSPAPIVSYKINMFAAKYLPYNLTLDATYDTFNKFTTIFSNVPGPKTKVYLAGEEVQSMNCVANSLCATSFALLSYNNKVQLNLVADKKTIPDPELITKLFVEEIGLLLEISRNKLKKPSLNTAEYLSDIAIVSATILSMLLVVGW
eukprot:CAMPEP_0203753044 /NCGR_PEP_ID=MMETSP0098-20131031/6866_1 /ASSEMBLY_ACC=CAM_ASM_000208 /TAXON_ID=96639 /ORGANISM=" , Strain NY0313808BC1" /LENGTH=495 /DNA_ID=CAMNT_0050643473 /DNA_START=1457 /DNA_END=2941 /DNA_ORIENTATION=-